MDVGCERQSLRSPLLAGVTRGLVRESTESGIVHWYCPSHLVIPGHGSHLRLEWSWEGEAESLVVKTDNEGLQP